MLPNHAPHRRAWTLASHQQAQRSVVRRAPVRCRTWLRAFAHWLEDDRDLQQASITLRLASASQFVASISKRGPGCVPALRRLTARSIEDFFVRYCAEHARPSQRCMQAAMRLALRFAVARGWVQRELIDAVPSLRSYQQSTLPRALGDQDLRRLLESAATASARNRAIVLLLACYGVRRAQVADLRFDDLDWRNRTIIFRAHKGGLRIRHDLIPAIASTIADYVKTERPASRDSHVFLRSVPPHFPISPNALGQLVHAWLKQLGVRSAPCGAHALRHAFAMRLVRARQPLKTIADLLGHRSLSATSIYAKLDHPHLFEVAVEWPVEVSP